MLTIILSLQVRLKGVKVCSQQSMSNDLQGGNLQFCQFGKTSGNVSFPPRQYVMAFGKIYAFQRVSWEQLG